MPQVEVSFGVAGVFSSLLIGWWIKIAQSYKEPNILCVACSVLGLLYVIFLVPEVSDQLLY